MTLEIEDFQRLVQAFAPGSTLIHAFPLTGGVSAQVTALEVAHLDGSRQKYVVRQHGAVDFQRNPNIASDEFALLKILQVAGVAAPAPIYVDSQIFATPVIVAEFIDGAPDFAPADLADHVRQLAKQLSLIHSVDPSAHDLSFLLQLDLALAHKLKTRPDKLDDSLSEPQIRDALEAHYPLVQQNRSVLLHGDYWSGNMLWKEGHLATIVDWEDATVGDPLADLANTRLELLWAFDIYAMNAFTNDYLAINLLELSNLPFWDLYAALRPASKLSTWGLESATEASMREKHYLFTTQAFAKLSTL